MSTLIHGFEIISKNPLPEFNAVGVYSRHKKTGLELYHILNDDDENLFSYNFMTSSPNSTGVAHIIEHTVLCGSKNYPLKDPFMVLAKQSVNTFLNAMTYPDKTVYPASSLVEADYFNLMSVYGDAVFFPNLDEWAFKQEGHRFELDENGKMSVQGVVLNEMRANYSDFDGVMYDWAAASICQGSIYAKDSGGSPLEIPDLTYEEYKAFHKKYYHPVNCRIFLMGNIPTEKQMKFLEEKFLSKFEAAEKPPFVPPIEPYTEPRFFSVPAPAGSPDSAGDTASAEEMTKDSVMLNWLLPETSDTEKLMQAYLIGEVLIGHSGACLNKVLLESGIGEDLYPYNGIGKSLRNITLTIGMKGIKKETHEDFKKLVFNALEELLKKGIDPKEIETAVHSIDFSNREIRRNYGPFGINLMERAMAGWTYGVSPEKTLQYTPVFEKVKKDLASDKRYIEKLIEKYLLKNKHHALVRVYPNADFCKRLDESLEKRAENFNAGLTEDARRAMLKEQEKMNEFKQKSDSPEKLALIPHLSKKDLPPLPPPIDEEIVFIGKVPLVMHEQPTNGIGYFQLAFPVDGLSEEDYKYLPLLSSCLTGMGTENLVWSEVSSRLANLLGGFSASAGVFTANKNLSLCKNADKIRLSDIAGRDWLFVSGKILGELISEAVCFVLQFLNEISFDDKKRLNDLVTQRKNDFESLLALDGNSLALLRAGAPLSEKNARREMLSGLSQLKFLRELYLKVKEDNSKKADSENADSELNKLSNKLSAVYKSIIKSGLIIEVTGTKENLAALKTAFEKNLKGFKAPDKTDKIVFENPFKFKPSEKKRLELIPASLQVGFAVSVFKAAAFGSKEQASQLILCKWLSSGPMWEKIRSIGGAYGAFTIPMSLEELLAFVSYRDPNPINSLSEFLNSIDETFSQDFSEEMIEKLITGRYSKEIIPMTPAGRGAAAFRDLLSGISYSEKKEVVEKMLETTAEDLRNCAKKLSVQRDSLSSVVLASDSALAQKETIKELYPEPLLSERV